jgi:hypothetical protein
LLQSPDQLASFEAIRRPSPGALVGKDALGFAYRGERYSITVQGILLVAVQTIISAFADHP